MFRIFLNSLDILLFLVEVFFHLQIIFNIFPIIQIFFFIVQFSTFHKDYVVFLCGQGYFKVFLFQIFICLLFHYRKENFFHDSI
jgi:hypothetical protein